jgi:hypothetical protein
MIGRIKLGKISIVVFLTALIWVWADLAQDEPLELSGVVIQIAKSSDPALWVSFVTGGAKPALATSITLDTVVLKGPASRVDKVSRLKNEGALDLNLFLAPEQENLTQAGDNSRDVLGLLKRSNEIGELGLTVESCEPRTLTVRVQKLVKTNVAVECPGLDPSVKVELDPPQVEAFVPADETLKAIIPFLTAAEQEQAKSTPVEKTPYLELAPGQRREVATKVKVTLAPAENVLHDYGVPATLGFCFSPNLQGKYRVVLDKDLPLPPLVLIKGTLLAYKAYYDAPYQMALYVDDADKQATEPIQRKVVFLFPEEYVRRDEIKANQPAPVARFRLEPVAGAEAAPTSPSL